MLLLIRQWNLFRGLLSRAVSFFESRNPAALLELEQENLRKRIIEFNSGLVGHAAASERLASQVKRGEAKSADLANRIKALIKAGERQAAARLALEHQNVEAQLIEDGKQRERAETTFRQLVENRDLAVGEAKRKIEALRRDIGDLKTKRALANLEAMAQAMSDSLAGPGDSLGRLRDIVDEAQQKEDGRLRVYGASIDVEEQRLRETERAVVAEEALSNFLATESTEAMPLLLTDFSGKPEPDPVPRKRSRNN
jgi:phage shock protein A